MDNERKGIAFKKVNGQKEMHVHPDTWEQYKNTLPRNEKGWIIFKYLPQPKGRTFAKIEPENK